MLRSTVMLVLLTLVLGVPTALAQTKKSAAPARVPTDKDPSVSVIVYLRDNAKNELLLATRIWPDNPDYNAVALQRFFALMKMLEPAVQEGRRRRVLVGPEGQDVEVQHLPRVRGCRHQVRHRRRRRLRAERRQQRAP